MSATLVVCAVALAICTYIFRTAGLFVTTRPKRRDQRHEFMRHCAVFLIAGVMITSTLLEQDSFAGIARILGVATAGVALALRAPLVLAIFMAIAVTGMARLAGLH